MDKELDKTLGRLINSEDRVRIYLTGDSYYTGKFVGVEDSGEVLFETTTYDDDLNTLGDREGEQNVTLAIPISSIVFVMELTEKDK